MPDFVDFLKQAAHVKPSPRQLQWYEKGFYAFIHFSPNTYTGLEWGTGAEDPALFNPVSLDCDQWVEAIKSAGMKGMILTAKHHDGYCLWPTKSTEHCIRNSPFQQGRGDIVRAAADACRRGGIDFGFYLSPWDRNSPLYGTNAYNDFYKAQLTELLTGYGDVFMVWFDGACGEGPNGKKQAYDFAGYIDLVRHYQPNAVIFHDAGPDVRWIGNEAGATRHAEWAVVPCELAKHSDAIQTGPGPMPGDLSAMYNTDASIGSLSNIIYSKGLCFLGAEADMSIRPGWFYHPQEEPHSLERLFQTYCATVGGNACFNLNIPPMPNGRLDDRDVRRLAELGRAIRGTFDQNRIDGMHAVRESLPGGDTQCMFAVTLPQKRAIRFIELRERMAQGQRIETFLLKTIGADGNWQTIYDGTTVGNRKLCEIATDEAIDVFWVCVTSARDRVDTLNIAAYGRDA